MKVSKLLTVLLFSFFIVGYLACKKTDSLPKMNSIQPEKLFVLPSNATSPIKKIVQTIEKQNAAHPFIETFIKKEGMPIWDKSSVFLSSNNKSSRNGGFSTDTIVLVPVAKESDSIVKSFLACNVNADTVLIRLIRDWEYKNYSFENREDTMTANALALQMMSFQKNVFGDSVFYIKDSRLFNYKNALGAVIKPERITIRSSSKSARQANNAMFISWVECVPVVYDGDQGNLVGVAPGGSNDYPGEIGTVCYYNSIWIDDSGGGGTVGGGDPIGGSGGGGGSSWYDGGTDPCAGSTTPTPIPRLSTAAPVDGCGSGWTPVTPPTYTSTLPPYIINDLTNPCLNKILIRLSGGTQNTFFKQIYNVFDASTNLQMSFRQGSLANINAYGLCNYIPSSSIGPIADITLDADVLMKCSQEWMAYVLYMRWLMLE